MRDIVIIGISGGTGSGKTTIAQALLESFHRNSATYIPQDNYYKDRSNMMPQEREEVNYDHPKSIDMGLLIEQIKDLQNGKSIEMPIYNFITHNKRKETKKIFPHKYIIIDGTLILHDDDLRNLLNSKVFIELNSDLRFIRRLQRDTKERGRTAEAVIKQYIESVKPMYHKFIEPTRNKADILLLGDDPVEKNIQKIKSYLKISFGY